MSIDQETLRPGHIVSGDLGVCAPGLSLWSVASGVLLLALSWGDLDGFLTR
jgi:hypothetical protein